MLKIILAGVLLAGIFVFAQTEKNSSSAEVQTVAEVAAPVEIPKSQELFIDGDHGKLSAVLKIPDGAKNFPLVILCHGFTGNKNGLMLPIARELSARGIASIRFDFNGHGDSDGDFQDMTILNEIEDAKKVYAYAKNLPGVTSIAVAGHSQGGVVAAMLAGELGAENIKAVALMAPAAVLKDYALRGNILGIRFNPENPPEYVEFGGGLRLGKNYILTTQTLPIFETAKNFHGAAFMVHGTADIAVPYTDSLKFQEIYPGSKVELLENFDHGFSQNVSRAVNLVADFFVQVLK